MTTAETQDCAHVCTSKIIQTTGHVDFLPAENGDRRFGVVGAMQFYDTPPSNWVGHISDYSRCIDLTAHHQKNASLSDYYAWASDLIAPFKHTAHRHQLNGVQVFSVRISREVNGRPWTTTTKAVMDDFGWLVEVPTC